MHEESPCKNDGCTVEFAGHRVFIVILGQTMLNRRGFRIIFVSLAVAHLSQATFAQQDVADIRSKTIALQPGELQYILVVGPGKLEAPRAGYKLLIVLPGGDGSAEFLPFVKRIYKYALDDEYLVVQLIAPQWNKRQQIVWPTAHDDVPGKRVSVEKFLERAVDDLRARTRIDDRCIFTLSWSSGGPAAYAASLSDQTSVTGSFVAMSVFKPRQLPDLGRAKGKRYFILHSPQDSVCPYRMAVAARDELRAHGADVEFAEYAGGHGWRGNVFGNIRRGIEWLEADAPE